MSLNQFLITFLVALILGVLLSNVGKVLLKKIVHVYRKLTFRHVLLTPYTPKKQKKDNQ
jgi:hypothetical protein